MDALEQPLLPSAAAPGDAADAATAPGDAADAATALQQIRSLLDGAGVTAAMLDPPAGVAPGAAAVDAAVVRQIGALLVEAGVTAAALGLPGAAADPRDDDAAERGAGSALGEGHGADASLSLGADAVDVEDPALATHSDNESVMASLRKMLSQRETSHDKTSEHSLAERMSMLFNAHPPIDPTTEHPIAQDLYSMIFLSENWSVPFLYAVLTILGKFAMYAMVMYWIYRTGGFRDAQLERKDNLKETDSNYARNTSIVTAMQLLLIPVAIGIDEELMLTMEVVSDMGWAACATRPHATQLKYRAVNAARALDGLVWLAITGSLMFHAVDVLEMFLNFAALQFLQSVDNIAFGMAQGGYLSRDIKAAALDVTKTKLPSLDSTWRGNARGTLLVLVFLGMLLFWFLIDF